MGLWDFFRKRSLSVDWEFTTRGVIWTLFPHEDRLLVGEERNLAAKEVSFFCLDRMTGSPLWKDVTLDEKWWIGIEAAYGDTVFLHEYASPDMPEHKKIIAINTRNGSPRWIDDQLSFIDAHDGFVYGRKNLFEDDKVYQLNITDGGLVRIIDATRDPLPPVTEPASRVRPEYPSHAQSAEEFPSRWKLIVRRLTTGREGLSGYEYIEHANHLLMSWYERPARPGDPTMRLLFRIADATGTVRYADTVGENAAAVIPDTFFLVGNRIFYIKERTHLRSINLGTEE